MLLNPSLLSYNWIVSKRTDLIWFILSSLSAYVLIYMYGGLGWDMATIWFFWVTFIDSPHFFGTYTRTYLDRVEFRNRKKLLLGSLLWVLAGPTVILICYVLYNLDSSFYELPWSIFVALFSWWAFWHVVRQHYGFLSLYKKKNKDHNPIDFYIDSSLLYISLLMPFFVFILGAQESRKMIMDVSPQISASMLDAAHSFMLIFVVILITISFTIYLFRQIYLYSTNQSVSVPKALFLLSILTLHLFIGYSPIVASAGLLGFGAFVTIYHDFQYHAIVWFHHKNRYSVKNSFSVYGLSSKIAKSLPIYICCALVVGILFRLTGCAFQVHPGCIPIALTSEVYLFGAFATDKLLLGILFGIAMNHYFLDQNIWKTSKDKQLEKDLKIVE